MGKDYPQIWRIIQVSERFPIQKFATLEKKFLPDELYTAEALGHLGHVGLLAMQPLVDLGLNLGLTWT